MKPVLAVAVLSLGIAAFTFATLAHADAPTKAPPTTAPATAPSTAPAPVNVGNTKCIVSGDDIMPGLTLTYQGKIYHLCCPDCISDFNKNPAKYIQAITDNPAKYGITKK